MLDSTLQGTYDRLHTLAQKYNKYAIPEHRITESILWVALFGVILFVAFGELRVTYLNLYLVPIVLLYFLVSSVVRYFLGRKLRAYKPSPDELVTYYSCGIMMGIENLRSPTTKGKPQLRKDYQKVIEQLASKLLSVIQSSWTYSDFKLASNVFGESLVKLKEGIRQKVIPSIENSDPEDLEKIETILLTLVYARSVSNIETVNNSIAQLKELPPQRKGHLVRVSNYLMKSHVIRFPIENKLAQYTLVMGSIIMISLVVYLIGVYVVVTSRDNSYIAAVSIGGVLTAGYLFQQGRKQK